MSEAFSDDNTDAGRSLRMETDPAVPGSHSDFKLIIFGDPNATNDIPSFEFYDLSSDENEMSPLNTNALSATEQAALDALRAFDTSLGGTYSAPVGGGN